MHTMASPPCRQLECAPLREGARHALRAFGWETYSTNGWEWYHNEMENVWSWTAPWAHIFVQHDAPVMRSLPSADGVPPVEIQQAAPPCVLIDDSSACHAADATLMHASLSCPLHTVSDCVGNVWPDMPQSRRVAIRLSEA